jgi:type I restriction enzyme M protein
MYDLLVVGGRCGVIVPDGVLFGTSNAHIATRKILLDKCKLEGVVSMPSGVFKPYAGVSTAVLVFQKGGTTDDVWFYDMEADGFSLDDKRQKIEANDIPDIIDQWKQSHSGDDSSHQKNGGESSAFRMAAEPSTKYVADRKGKSILVSAEEIRANKYEFSISRYREIERKQIEYQRPETIVRRVLELEGEIVNNLNEIERNLK